jgi:hypothetical protein
MHINPRAALLAALAVLTLLVAVAVDLSRSTTSDTAPKPIPTTAPTTPSEPTASPSPTATPSLPRDEALALLRRFDPVLQPDSREQFRPVRVDELIDDPDTALRRDGRNGEELASPDLDGADKLSLAFLGHDRYANGQPVQPDDTVSLSDSYDDWAAWLSDHDQGEQVAYARAIKGSDGLVVLEYWWFYLFHDALPWSPDAALANTGDREGDLVLAQVRLSADGHPFSVTYSQHGKGETRPWDEVRHDGEHPVLYPSWGVHAGLFEPGRYRTKAVVMDWNDDKGKRVTPTVELLDDDPNARWANWPGHLGDAGTPCLWAGWPAAIDLAE